MYGKRVSAESFAHPTEWIDLYAHFIMYTFIEAICRRRQKKTSDDFLQIRWQCQLCVPWAIQPYANTPLSTQMYYVCSWVCESEVKTHILYENSIRYGYKNVAYHALLSPPIRLSTRWSQCVQPQMGGIYIYIITERQWISKRIELFYHIIHFWAYFLLFRCRHRWRYRFFVGCSRLVVVGVRNRSLLFSDDSAFYSACVLYPTDNQNPETTPTERRYARTIYIWLLLSTKSIIRYTFIWCVRCLCVWVAISHNRKHIYKYILLLRLITEIHNFYLYSNYVSKMPNNNQYKQLTISGVSPHAQSHSTTISYATNTHTYTKNTRNKIANDISGQHQTLSLVCGLLCVLSI